MTLSFSAAARNALLAALAARVDAGSAPGYLQIRSGVRPANVDTAATGTLLVTITLADPAFETPAAGSMALDADPDLSGAPVATGTATWARVYDSTGVAVMDGSVGTAATDFVITSTSIATGQPVLLTTGTITTTA